MPSAVADKKCAVNKHAIASRRNDEIIFLTLKIKLVHQQQITQEENQRLAKPSLHNTYPVWKKLKSLLLVTLKLYARINMLCLSL